MPHVSPAVAVALVLTTFVSIALGWALGVADRRRRSTKEGAAALVSLEQLAAAFAGLKSDLEAQCGETERARAQRDEQARKANEYFVRIEGIVKEADDCRRLLVRTGAEHGNAQAMMIAEIDSLTGQYRALAQHYRTATGKAPPRTEPALNRSIQVVAADFREAHVAPYEAPMAPPTGTPPVQASPLAGG